MTRKARNRTLAAIFILVGIGGAIILGKMKPPPEKKAEVDTTILIDALPLAETSTAFAVESQGTVQPRTETIVSAEVAGTITWVSPKFVAGGVFAEGEQLLRIDPTNYRVAVDQAKALLEQREIEYQSEAKLKGQGYRTESDYAAAAAALASAKAGLVRARRDLERTRIRLPYAGIVKAKEADLGQYVTPAVV